MKIGEKRGRLTLIELFKKRDNKKTRTYGKFVCECGTRKEIDFNNVRRGITVSCGCFQKEQAGNMARRHGMVGTSVYISWQKLKHRCLGKNNHHYEQYKDLGVSDSWLKFENFYADMGDRPKDRTIERIDNSKGYSKENCRWATRKEQQNNCKSNVLLTHNGKTQTMMMWSEELNISYLKIRSRVVRGKTGDDLFSKENKAERLMTHEGKTMNLKQWAELKGIKENTLRGRLFRGMKFEDAL